ncbi:MULTISPECIES: thiamine diphosphokinase [Anaerococcus]|jgi:thiamine diphosphokinase|uniref:thiamine diphosphokinase n=1 Tax=Anaerococcus TaxID=165779 RepID=UPI001AE9EAA1|nr:MULTISPECIES: thiamine diphosphokinase [Anaerococcus]MBP2068877.1 thiamine pyrophosphokinase [Anaerococcus nagyae]MDU2566014.1 thiamine diphosphokinase [Anaerococcus sp.]
MKRCFIIAGGDFDGFYDQIRDDDLVIAADRGFDHAKKSGINPDIIIGDFDSSDKPIDNNKVIKLNPIKDYTDTKAAMMIAKDKDYDKIIIYGGLGGRDSHTFANIRSSLEYKKLGIDVIIKSKYKKIFIINDSFTYKFKNEDDFYVSIFALSEVVKGISISGLFYELNDYDLTLDSSLGVSNETCKKDFSINVNDGYLLIIFENKNV